MSSVFGDNIARLRAERGLTQRELAMKLGVSKSTIGAWETSGTLPDFDRMKEVTDFFQVPMPKLFAEYSPARDEEEFSSEELKVLGSISAGTPVEMECGDYGFPCPSYLLHKHPKAFFLTVDGESMNRTLPNGCLALIDPVLKDPIINNAVYAVCVNGYDATVKRVRQLENGVELVPDSTDPTFHPMVYDHTVAGTESITIIGRVVWYTVPFDFEI
ncbi:MAG: XRE family transcriptional regulator [Atopobium minutum]|uniref:LexA family protein n=1 Tax=Atopobium minutum TaxID=1381 RepID=UPI00290B24F5|nr:XRE family transcriptional regulator [Atopobium minutum]MDU4969432.1 XRE family transcriptional regulator [Atopobium minutum]MDU5356498.1 XRE family transcriptional regulator [Atopobium minutum]MDU5892779.1 XRE family transcriptional regulator [Atopobium minutum]